MKTTVQVHTAQNVTIEYEVASLGDRILASITDSLLVGAVAVGAFFGFTLIDMSDDLMMILLVALVVPLLCYHLLCELFMNGQSFGKKLRQIRVVRVDGGQPTFGNYLIRWITRFFEVQIFYGVPATLAVAMGEKGQRLGDMAAGTCVVKIDDRIQVGDTIFSHLDADYELMYPNVTVLTDEDVTIVKEVLQSVRSRRRGVETKRLLISTAGVIARKLGVQVVDPPQVFLERVLKDFNFEEGRLPG